MLSCENVTAKLSAQLDGELSLGERLSIRWHQFMCSDCKNAAQNMRALVLGLQNRVPGPESVAESTEGSTAVSDDYVDKIMLALEERHAGDEGRD